MYLMLFLLFLLSCEITSTNNITVVQVISQKDALESVSERRQNFDGRLSITITLDDIRVSKSKDDLSDPHVVALEVTFLNISSDTLVLKKPISLAITDPPASIIYDLTIIIENDSNIPMSVTPMSNFVSEKGLSKVPREESLSDFIQLSRNDKFALNFETRLPIVLFGANGFVGNLPKGNYFIYLQYSNIKIGYKLPLEITPPFFSDVQSEEEWYFENIKVADLNAWVGIVKSNKVEFSIP